MTITNHKKDRSIYSNSKSNGNSNNNNPSSSASASSSTCFIISASVIIYLATVSLIPIYNKYFFQKSLYPYPIATAAIQLGVVSILCGIVNSLQHYYYYYNGSSSSSSQRALSELSSSSASAVSSSSEQSWIGGPYFWWKVQWCVPIGALFGLKYSCTNLGLQLVSASTHVLLQATDLVWTVVGAYLITKERSTCTEVLCLVFCILGSILLSYQILIDDKNNNSNNGNNTNDATGMMMMGGSSGAGSGGSSGTAIFAIVINLTSPILLGLCLSTLRLACKELMGNTQNRVRGTVSSIELTCIKLMISSSVAFVLACLHDGPAATTTVPVVPFINTTHYNEFTTRIGINDDDDNDTTNINHNKNTRWYAAFLELSGQTQLGVIGGAVLILIFQVNCTYLTYLTSTIAVGLVGQVKIIPQYIVATIFNHLYNMHSSSTRSSISNNTRSSTIMNGIGAVLIMSSALAFGILNLPSSVDTDEKKKRIEEEEQQDDDASNNDTNDSTADERTNLLLSLPLPN